MNVISVKIWRDGFFGLADSFARETDFMKTSFINSQKLPLVVEPLEDCESLAKLFDLTAERRDFFRRKLLECGALLFRGFEVRGIEDFRNFARHFSGKEFFNYAGGVSPRVALNENVYTSTEYPPDLPLALHNEMSYSQSFPRHIYFFCDVEPQTGGETTLGDSRRILQKIEPSIVERFERKNVRYDRYLYSGADSEYSWQAAFETGDRRRVEEICRASGAIFEWQANGGLRVSQIRPATVVHPETGEAVWFNQADGFHPSNLDEAARKYYLSTGENYRLNSLYGDGSAFEPETLAHVRRVLREETIPHRWRSGDVLVLDNLLAAHGRMPFFGARKIAVAMT